jgi:hypothetical protein
MERRWRIPAVFLKREQVGVANGVMASYGTVDIQLNSDA